MHQTTRRPTTALLALLAALALVLAACGGEDTAGDPTTDADAGEETPAGDAGAGATEDPNEGTAADADASPPSTVGGTEGGDDTAAFLEDPSYYLTENPTLTGTVQEVVAESGFTLGGEDWQDVTVFVAATEEQLSQISTGDEVTVSGELREIQDDEINAIAAQAQDVLGVSVDERYLQSLTGGYALIPDTVVQGGATEGATESP